MSYCRWSSDSFRCDLYAYESYEGYEIHVAVLRHQVPEHINAPGFPKFLGDDNESREYEMAAYEAATTRFKSILESVPLEPIGLSQDGHSFVYEDWEEFIAKMKDLVAEGYRVPAGLIEYLERE